VGRLLFKDKSFGWIDHRIRKVKLSSPGIREAQRDEKRKVSFGQSYTQNYQALKYPYLIKRKLYKITLLSSKNAVRTYIPLK
jgi:hypothetical protein